MAVYTENFRSAFNGFHRADVVQFIQRLTAEHERELRLLREENARLLHDMDAARQEMAALEQKHALLSQELEQAKQSAASRVPEPCAAPAPELHELEAYRRAEMAERMARERAAASAARLRTLFAQTENRLNQSAKELDNLADAFHTNYEQLLQALDAVHQIMEESTAGLSGALKDEL